MTFGKYMYSYRHGQMLIEVFKKESKLIHDEKIQITHLDG
jgi:hypothetical protein